MTFKEKIVQLILLNGGFVVVAIVVGVLVALLSATACSFITSDIQTIQIVTITAVWLSEIALIIIKSKISIALKIKELPLKSKEQIYQQEIKRALIMGIVFAISLAIVLYGVFKGMSEGVEQNYTSSLKFKITICVLLVIYLIARYYIRKQKK